MVLSFYRWVTWRGLYFPGWGVGPRGVSGLRGTKESVSLEDPGSGWEPSGFSGRDQTELHPHLQTIHWRLTDHHRTPALRTYSLCWQRAVVICSLGNHPADVVPDGVFVQSIQTLFCAHYLQEPKILISPQNWQTGLEDLRSVEGSPWLGYKKAVFSMPSSGDGNPKS